MARTSRAQTMKLAYRPSLLSLYQSYVLFSSIAWILVLIMILGCVYISCLSACPFYVCIMVNLTGQNSMARSENSRFWWYVCTLLISPKPAKKFVCHSFSTKYHYNVSDLKTVVGTDINFLS